MSASDIRAGGAYIEIGSRLAANYNANWQDAQAKLTQFSQSVGQVAAGIAKVGAAIATTGAAATAALLTGISAASAYEEIGAKFDTVMGDNAASVRDWARTFSNEVGRSRSDMEGFLAAFQDTFVPLGFDRKEASELSKQLTKLTVDLASFNNAAQPEVMMALQSAIVGNHETVRRFGVIIDEASLSAELLATGVANSTKDATAAEKAYARLNMIVAGTEDAQGDAARTSGSWANTMRALSAAVNDLQIAIGDALIPVVQPLIELLKEVTRITTWIADTFPIVTQVIFAASVAMTAFGVAMLFTAGAGFVLAGAINMVNGAMALGATLGITFIGVMEAIGSVWAVASGIIATAGTIISGAIASINGALVVLIASIGPALAALTIPLPIIAAFLAAIAAAIAIVIVHWEQFAAMMRAVWTVVYSVVSLIWRIPIALAKAVASFLGFERVVNMIKEAFNSLGRLWDRVVKGIEQRVQDLLDAFAQMMFILQDIKMPWGEWLIDPEMMDKFWIAYKAASNRESPAGAGINNPPGAVATASDVMSAVGTYSGAAASQLSGKSPLDDIANTNREIARATRETAEAVKKPTGLKNG